MPLEHPKPFPRGEGGPEGVGRGIGSEEPIPDSFSPGEAFWCEVARIPHNDNTRMDTQLALGIHFSIGFLRVLKKPIYNLYNRIDTKLSMYTKLRYTH